MAFFGWNYEQLDCNHCDDDISTDDDTSMDDDSCMVTTLQWTMTTLQRMMTVAW
jgi:hypothetical protein